MPTWWGAHATSARNTLPSVPWKAVMGRVDQVPSPARPSAVRLAIRVGGGERGSAQARNALEHHRDGDGLRAALRGLRGRRAEDVGTSQSSPSMRWVARGIGDQSSGTRSTCPGRMRSGSVRMSLFASKMSPARVFWPSFRAMALRVSPARTS